MKKYLILFLSLVLMLTFVACSSNDAANNTQPVEETVQEETTEEATEEETVASEKEMLEDTFGVYVTPEYVKQMIDGQMEGSDDFVILHGSWGPADVSEEYQTNHIPGAVHMNTDDIEEPEYWNIRTPEEITEVMAKYGITKDTTVIVYGADSGAARIAFVSLWAGVENVKVLDGGVKAWMAAGYETEEGINEPVATSEAFGLTIPAHPEFVIAMPAETQAELDSNENFRLVSIRSKDEFEGKISGYSYIERMGEPAGALWGHDEFDYLNEDGTIKGIENVESILSEQGITKDHDIAFYCGTGWRATIPFLIAYENGWENIQLFDGGWFAWQMDENNPVQSITPEEAASKYE
ncbi:sulfurtransferase [Acidaminobacter sp. JC074]|uniref:sulfurtransferase n=1 Tax=Acidaminobacter sp. JC074 TaxID=2530199 RepID=UPI001F0FAF0A|nr:rhodanese-like domain-containing protein [Acidaminobacter sp. JC074]MCH4890296.1 sulfurtransferase [Acidaminobacter sp. JC074]